LTGMSAAVVGAATMLAATNAMLPRRILFMMTTPRAQPRDRTIRVDDF
jgi:hypothetical protein